MKKKHYIGWLLAGAAAIFLMMNSAATAADKVVVIPLESGNGDSGGVRTVMSAGQVWMDRNLGALRVAAKSDDSKAYGSLYQWGRLGDGHEYRESPETDTLSPGNVPGHGHFIKNDSGSPWNWMTTPNSDLWKGESGINNPCPAGFRLPMATEWETERSSWGHNNAVGAFTSPLRLVVAGLRHSNDGAVLVAGILGCYWSSTVNGVASSYLTFDSGNDAHMNSLNRARGFSVRCIKD